ncbi:tetratricopeptide repeat protein [Streptomyces sp. NPDC091027]|uniref:tetratricopeptide repeat protein n=1 Tax=Streptomyces sp. NPDC091027 TaxID=3365971 RepID=UPI003814850B
MMIRTRERAAAWAAWAKGSAAPWHTAALAEVNRCLQEGSFEEAEARARAVVAAREGRRGRDRRPAAHRKGRYFAVLAAVLHGRGAEVLDELEGLIADLEGLTGPRRTVLLHARLLRAVILTDQGRPAEAEKQAEYVLRAAKRITHLTDLWELELWALLCLAEALCAQGRHTEAEAIARGHLPHAEDHALTALHCLLLRSLSGQGRHEEALAESDRPVPDPVPAAAGELPLVVAEALHGLGRHEQAKQEALRALAICERAFHADHPRTAEVRSLLDRLDRTAAA